MARWFIMTRKISYPLLCWTDTLYGLISKLFFCPNNALICPFRRYSAAIPMCFIMREEQFTGVIDNNMSHKRGCDAIPPPPPLSPPHPHSLTRSFQENMLHRNDFLGKQFPLFDLFTNDNTFYFYHIYANRVRRLHFSFYFSTSESGLKFLDQGGSRQPSWKYWIATKNELKLFSAQQIWNFKLWRLTGAQKISL